MTSERSKRHMQEMIRKVYFGQAEHYFSESKDDRGEEAVLKIDEMHPNHAANAAAKLLREANFWALEVGVTGTSLAHPQLWITTTILFQALTWRAGV